MMLVATGLLLLSFLPAPGETLRDEVDVVEVNHVINDVGRETLAQVIWWNFSDCHGCYQVVDWRLAETVAVPVWIGQRWVSLWFDCKAKCVREVVARVSRQTATGFDPELEDRNKLPEEWRIGLRK